ncbi:MAG TPA: ABC transporter ATP-binding protein, partial [Flexilinea sp.]|nr:ABC transporter ATP-binding protein [Flexilinea sp.]
KYFLFGPIFMVIEATGDIVLPFLVAQIINNGAVNHDIPYILRTGGLMVGFSVIMAVFGTLGAKFAVNGSVNLAADLRFDVFSRIQEFSFKNIDDFSTGSLITRITNDITQIQTFAMSLLRGVFRSPVMLIGAVIMAFRLNSQLAIVILIVIPVLGSAIFTIITKASPRFTTMQEQLDKLNSDISESLTNIRVIKSFVREDYENKDFSVVNEGLREKSIAAMKMVILQQPVITATMNITTLAVVWFAGRQIIVGSMPIGNLAAFITYITQILMSLNLLANIFLQGSRAIASSKRINQVMETKIELDDSNAAFPEAMVEKGEIEFRHVSFRYFKTNHENVLDDINLAISAGETVGMIGSTGSGKTTMVQLIPRLYDADEGEVLVDGINVKDYSLKKLREGVALVLQKNTLFSGTIAENLQWGNEYATEEEMRAAARIAQAESFIDSLPDGFETDLGQGGVNLSGGQKQRLCIARALLKKPKILILDDSTSAVDTATEAKIRKAFSENLQGITKIIIAQRINSVIDADKIVVLNEGKIVGCGVHQDLIKTCVPYQEIYYSQKEKNKEGE